MPKFDLTSGIKCNYRSGAMPKKAYDVCQDTVRTFAQRGYDMAFLDEKPPWSFKAKLTDSKGTALNADVKVVDEGETTRVDIVIAGYIFLGGILGRMINANMIHSRAEAKLNELLAEKFAGEPAKRAPLKRAPPKQADPPKPAAPKPAAPPPAAAAPPPAAAAPPPAAAAPPAAAPAPPAAAPAPASAPVVEARAPAAPAPAMSGASSGAAAGALGGHQDLVDAALTGQLSAASDGDKAARVQELLRACATAAGATCVQPTPYVDVGMFNPIQVALVRAVGRVRGEKVDKAEASQVMNKIGASLVQQVGMLGSDTSGGSWVPHVATAYALTWAVGEAADTYYRDMATAPDTLQAAFEAAFERMRSEKVAAAPAAEALTERLEQVNEAFEADLLSEDEYMRLKERVLSGF
jgi:uncharacterized protein (DUF697 family)